MRTGFKLSCVLFDLDGTLVDTAPDLIACLNTALSEHGFQTADTEKVKPYISFGALAMIEKSQRVDDESQREQVLNSLLNHYENNIIQYGGFFQGILETLAYIESKNLKWGIITNKRKRFTQPLVEALNLTERAACIISGDSTANSKPHPEPMFAGCKKAKVIAEECVFIGDALHDISAGKNANMKTLAATYGYLTADDTPQHWGADALVTSPAQIKQWIENTLCH